ncbi:hypothetical protein NE865_09292 [Phthorimaea operculella]|nr:hypothetical protein NE865_09292 [Phthorimaea operculella]
MVFITFALYLGVVNAENELLNTRKEVLKVLTESMVEVYFNCSDDKLLYSNDVITDVLQFWNTKHELRHDAYGCALLCVAFLLELVDQNTEVILANATRLLVIHGADPDMIKTLIELYEYCRNTIYENIKGISNLEPCWLALEFMRCSRDGIEDMDWVPDVSDLIPKILMKFKSMDKRRSFGIELNTTITDITGNVSKEEYGYFE